MAAAVAGAALLGKGLDISLAALQQHDPYISSIVDVASQVALYTFGHRANEWEKTDVEGTLFVYTRSASPRHGFTIMNRLSMENRTEPITKDLDFQLQDPFLLYRNARYGGSMERSEGLSTCERFCIFTAKWLSCRLREYWAWISISTFFHLCFLI
uniref:5'-(N(7)-methylguanosine 5'-triphospho)-[mRNA] hydrolase n=1 Tax=Apteryx owenii TaxID=8824 RepID=A0A8B9Q2Q2_APTOW